MYFYAHWHYQWRWFHRTFDACAVCSACLSCRATDPTVRFTKQSHTYKKLTILISWHKNTALFSFLYFDFLLAFMWKTQPYTLINRFDQVSKFKIHNLKWKGKLKINSGNFHMNLNESFFIPHVVQSWQAITKGWAQAITKGTYTCNVIFSCVRKMHKLKLSDVPVVTQDTNELIQFMLNTYKTQIQHNNNSTAR